MSRDITKLHPHLQKKLTKLYRLCKKNGLKIGFSDCLRSVEEQDALYAKGRTAPGLVVTNATGCDYQSQHQWGIAFDFYREIKGHKYDDMEFFVQVGALARDIGLGWGGDWEDFPDYCHLYLPDWGDGTALLQREYRTPDQFRQTWPKSAGTFGVKAVMLQVYLNAYIQKYISR